MLGARLIWQWFRNFIKETQNLCSKTWPLLSAYKYYFPFFRESKDHTTSFGMPSFASISEDGNHSSDIVLTTASADQSLTSGLMSLSSMRNTEEYWEGHDYGPLCLLPCAVISYYIISNTDEAADFPQIAQLLDCTSPTGKACLKTLFETQNSDGGYGIGHGTPSTMLNSVLCYVAMRLMKCEPLEGSLCQKTQQWILEHGGPLGIPGWGKWWLSILGLYDHKGLPPIFPERVLLPPSPNRAREYVLKHLGLAPSTLKRFCQLPDWLQCIGVWLSAPSFVVYAATRPFWEGLQMCVNGFSWSTPWSFSYSSFPSQAAYLPMAFLSSRQWMMKNTPLLDSIRRELYAIPYESVPWFKFRFHTSLPDSQAGLGLSRIQKWIAHVMRWYELCYCKCLRHHAIKKSWQMVMFTNMFVDCGCLNVLEGFYHLIAIISMREEISSESYYERLNRLLSHLETFFFKYHDNLYVSWGIGNDVWQTGLVAQTLLYMNDKSESCCHQLRQAEKFLAKNQLNTDDTVSHPQIKELSCISPEEYWSKCRYPYFGGWGRNGSSSTWPLTYVTAECLHVLMLYFSFLTTSNICFGALHAVNWLLLMRKPGKEGGWSLFEFRHFSCFENLMSALPFSHGFTEETNVECTSSCVESLSIFRRYCPFYRSEEIVQAIQGGLLWLLNSESTTGGDFYRTQWICVLYKIWRFAESIHATYECEWAPKKSLSSAADRLRRFIISKQNLSDGGWGNVEFGNKDNMEFQSHVVQTAWAVMTLIALSKIRSSNADELAIVSGIKFLIKEQQANGQWLDQPMQGITNPIIFHFTGFHNIMPLWALGKYKQWKLSQASKSSGKGDLSNLQCQENVNFAN